MDKFTKVQQICNFKLLPKWSWAPNQVFSSIRESSFYKLGSILLFIFLALPLNVLGAESPLEKSFKLNLFSEPKSVDPLKNGSMTHFLFTNLYRNLLHYDGKSLEPDLAEFCRWQKSHTQVHCRLKKNIKWSDGSDITTQDFINNYKKIIEIQAYEQLRPLLKIKGVKEKIENPKIEKQIGIKALSPRDLLFELQSAYSDFLWSLSSYGLSPSKENLYSGPYLLKEWLPGKKMILEGNSFYWKKSKDRPRVEVLFIPEDHMAFELYQKNELSFLRRLPTQLIPKFEKSAEYHWLPVLRLDYIGLRESIPLPVRQKMQISLNYEQLQKIFNSRYPVGCFGIPEEYYGSKKDLCLKYSPQKEKITTRLRLSYAFSSLGGEGHKRAAEYQQNQWQKELGLNIEVQPKENKIFEAELYKYDIFRKGVSPNNPTCLSALESFHSLNKNNWLHFKSKEFDQIILSLEGEFNKSLQKQLCYKGLKILLQSAQIIPLGQIEFSLLVKPEFKGWSVDNHFQLDLTELKAVKH